MVELITEITTETTLEIVETALNAAAAPKTIDGSAPAPAPTILGNHSVITNGLVILLPVQDNSGNHQ